MRLLSVGTCSLWQMQITRWVACSSVVSTYTSCWLCCRPHVNVVSGTNGSGKSAVLQGLQCCLGASARETGRAPNMGQFIRTGADEAKVQVGAHLRWQL